MPHLLESLMFGEPPSELEGLYIDFTDEFVEACRAANSIEERKNLFAKYAYKRDPTFATSPIYIRDKDYDFSLDLSYISIVEKEPFCGLETRTALEHMNELSALSSLFSDDQKKRMYFVTKTFPFSLKGEAKSWYDSLTPRSIGSPMELVNTFFHKYFPASAQHAALHKILDFVQEKEENLPESWARFVSLMRTLPNQPLPRNELIDIFYNGLTVESRTFLDSCAGGVFRNKTLDEAEELIAKISKNHDDWSTPTLILEPISIPTLEPTPTPAPKKRGMLVLNEEKMKEAKKYLKEKGIKSKDVKNLPPIEDLCKPIRPSPMIEVHSLRSFDEGDVPYLKPPDQCL